MTNEDREAAGRGLREVLEFAGEAVVEEVLARVATLPEDVDIHVYVAQVAEIAREVVTRHVAAERAALAAMKVANARQTAVLDALQRPTDGRVH
jgi:hypothetical protein